MRNLKKITMLLSAAIFLASPALAQQVATTNALMGQVKTSDRLVPPKAENAGGKLLPRETSAESRPRDRSLLQKRIIILRNYLATTTLSERERLAVENSVRELEASLSEVAGAGTRALRSASALNKSRSSAKSGTAATSNSVVSGQDSKDGQDNPPPASTKKEEKHFFDTRKFSLSGGVVLSRLEKREFQPVLGIARDINGTPTNGNALTYVVGLKENNDWNIGPVLLLNTKFWERADRNFGLHGSVGITGKRDNAGTDIDYFFGPSVSFIRGLVFFSGGVYVGKQQRLAGDAFLGAAIDKGDTVPVVKEYHSKPGFSLTFRIFPLPD
jgi:hypothetical protein